MERTNGRLIGIGVVIGVEPGGRNAARDMAIFPESKQMPGAGGVEGATVKIEKNGGVVVTLGSPSCGQSHGTTASQIVGEILGIVPERISMAGPFDSLLSPWGVSCSNSGNNFHLYDVGAVHGAATRLREKILTLSSHVLQAEKSSLFLQDGVVSSGADAARRSASPNRQDRHAWGPHSWGFEPGLEVTPRAPARRSADAARPARACPGAATFSSAAHAAVVEVVRETGQSAFCAISSATTAQSTPPWRPRFTARWEDSVARRKFVYGPDGQLLTLTLSTTANRRLRLMRWSTTCAAPHDVRPKAAASGADSVTGSDRQCREDAPRWA